MHFIQLRKRTKSFSKHSNLKGKQRQLSGNIFNLIQWLFFHFRLLQLFQFTTRRTFFQPEKIATYQLGAVPWKKKKKKLVGFVRTKKILSLRVPSPVLLSDALLLLRFSYEYLLPRSSDP